MNLRKRLKAGDLLEIQMPQGLSYLQYVGKHPEYGDVIRVFPKCHQQRPGNFTQLVEDSGYLAFYSARSAVSAGFVEIVETLELPNGIEVPQHIRRAGARSPDGKVLTWIVENKDQETIHKELSESDKQLPIAAIWDHELLTLRILEGWSPEQEG